MEDTLINKIAANHNVSSAELCLAWALQRGTSEVVKSANAQHQQKNLMAKNIQLSVEEMHEIAKLDRSYRYFRLEEWWGSCGKRIVPLFYMICRVL